MTLNAEKFATAVSAIPSFSMTQDPLNKNKFVIQVATTGNPAEGHPTIGDRYARSAAVTKAFEAAGFVSKASTDMNASYAQAGHYTLTDANNGKLFVEVFSDESRTLLELISAARPMGGQVR